MLIGSKHQVRANSDLIRTTNNRLVAPIILVFTIGFSFYGIKELTKCLTQSIAN
jgi:hypothetical protein